MKENIIAKMETALKSSRFAIVPILRRSMKSAVSVRIAEILQKSNFCSKNPVLKKLIIHNVQAYCIVIETSGTQSIKIICASVPYLVSLISKANPKFKRMLEDEKVVEYLKFFQEADMESFLTSLCTATVIIKKGLEMCYPTLSITLSREALLLGQETWKYFLKILRKGLVYAFHFVVEDLGPLLRSICAQNRDIVKYLTRNLPVFAFAGAKGLVIFSFLVRRIFRAILSSLKRFVINLKFALLEKKIDFSLQQVLKQLYVSVKHFAVFLVCGSAFQYFKYIYDQAKLRYLPAYKNILLILWNKSVEYVKYLVPIIKKFLRQVITFVSSLLDENNLRNFVNFFSNAKPLFHSFVMKIKPYYHILYDLALSLGTKCFEIGMLSLPYTRKVTAHLSGTLIRCIVCLIQHSLTLHDVLRDLLLHLHRIYPDLKNSVLKTFLSLLAMIKTFFKYIMQFIPPVIGKLRNFSMVLYRKISPDLYPVTRELNSILVGASTEIVRTSLRGTKRVVPSVWNAVRTVTPSSFYAMNELLMTSKNSVVIMYPALREAVVTIHPQVYRSLAVVLQDGNKVFVEIASVSFRASYHLGLAVKEMSLQLPVVLSALDLVTMSSLSATYEVFNTSMKAQMRVLNDLKQASFVVGASVKSAELELSSTFNEVILEVNCIISEHPEVGYFYKALTDDGIQISLITDKLSYFCYLSFLVTNSAFGLLKKFYAVFNKYFSNSGDGDSSYNFFHSALQRIIESSNCKHYATVAYDSLMGVISSVIYCAITFAQRNTFAAFSELYDNIVPNLWKSFKVTVSKLWKTECDVSDELWTFLEEMSIRIWKVICENSPHAWSTFKSMCQKMWLLTCEISPGLWEFMLSIAPVLWNSNRQAVKSLWKTYLQTCSQTWNVVVPLSSAAWEITLKNSPKVWLAASKNSKLHWEMFCSTAESSYEAVTDLSMSSWDVFNKLVSHSWNYAFRPATVSACNTTSSIVAKSIKLSYITYTQTGKFLLFCVESPGAKRLELISSKIGERASSTRNVIKKCVALSNENFLKRGSKRKLMFKAVKEMSSLPSRVVGWYLDCFKIENIRNNLQKMYKIPLIPITGSYTIGQELLKRYSSFVCSEKKLVFAVYLPDSFV